MNNTSITHNTTIHKELKTISALKKLISTLKLHEIFASISDERATGKTQYSLTSLLLWGVMLFAFRIPSKLAMHTLLRKANIDGLDHFLCAKKAPHSSTVDHAFALLSLEEIQNIPMQLFHRLYETKLIYNHQDDFYENKYITIGLDGVWTHTYNHHHASHSNGSNACPFCCKRVYDKGTPQERIQWQHISVSAVCITHSMKLPLYVHQLQNQEAIDLSDHALKAHSELAAARIMIPKIRAQFPRERFLILGDALYANAPMIRLCQQYQMAFLFVMKEHPLQSVYAKCNELAQMEEYRRHCCHKNRHEEASWFNHVHVTDDIYVNVLRYRTHSDNGKEYTCDWICSEPISQYNCFAYARQARMRWQQEEMHNMLKHRGYELKHDYARANPHLAAVWHYMRFISVFIMELFSCLQACKEVKGAQSNCQFLRYILHYIFHFILNLSDVIQQNIQLRYHFSRPP